MQDANHHMRFYTDQPSQLTEYLNTPPHSPYLDPMLYYPERANSWDAAYSNMYLQPYQYQDSYQDSYQDFLRRGSIMSRGLPRGRAVMLGSMLTRPYQCDHLGCGKMFKRSEHLKRHYRSIHTQDRPFVCHHSNCNKRFSRSDNLAQHMRIHRSNDSPNHDCSDHQPQTQIQQVPRGRPVLHQPALHLPKLQLAPNIDDSSLALNFQLPASYP